MPTKLITLNDLYAGQQVMLKVQQEFSKGQEKLFKSQNTLSEGQKRLLKSQDTLSKDLHELKDLTTAGFDTMNDRFDRLEAQVDRLEARVSRLDTHMTYQSAVQRAANVRWERSEGKNQAVEADIKEIYAMIASLKHRHGKQLAADAALNRRVQHVEAFVRELSAQTGIPYKA